MCAIIEYVMGKCFKSIALSVIAAVFGVLALSGPVFATPTDTNNNDNSSVVTDDPNDADPEDQNGTTDTNNTENSNNGETNSENTESTTSCYDQVGSLGWIICPGAGLFGNIIDGAYNILTNLIQIDPLPTEHESPIYIAWDYFKNITNIIFIIFFLVIIFSQLTGVGINNYGIKRTLPRIVLAAILVNLSYLICVLSVDVSNILGAGFYGIFENIQNTAIENGVISSTAASSSISAIVAATLGIGTAGAVFAGAVALGSFEGIIWMILPVLLSGVIAVASAVITMAARQALIFILVMISPLAIIAYMLPNTDKLFKKWLHVFSQMIFFYPMFAILYGASQLCGLIIISSATNWLTVILGIAVKVLPLFMSIPLMRMSNTVLGRIDGLVHRATAPAQGAVGRFAASQGALAKQKQLNKANPVLPSTRLAQYMERRRVQREFDTRELTANNLDKNTTRAMAGWYDKNGKVNKRGHRHNQNELNRMRYATIRTNIESDFDEGFEDDDKRIYNRDRKKLAAINRGYADAIVDDHAAQVRKRTVALNNMENKAKRIRADAEEAGSQIHQQVLDSFNIDHAAYKVAEGATLTAAEQAAYNAGDLTASELKLYNTGQKAINATLADAIAAKRKVDNEARSNYYELYDDSPAGLVPGNALTEALKNGDYNSMNAAIAVMAKRGDHKDIMEILRNHSKELIDTSNSGETDNAAIRFQKEINDACLALKADNPVLWAWAKSNMIRRGKYNHDVADGKAPKLEAFIDFESFVNGSHMPGDTLDLSTHVDANGDTVYNNTKDKSTYDMIAMESILTNVRDGKLFAGADRTMYNYFLSAGKDGLVDSNHYLFTDIKHLRASACSGMMDGEQLASFNNYMTYGYSKNGDNTFFFNHRDDVHATITKYFKDMTAGQLASIKTATLMQFNDAFLALNNDGVDRGGGEISQELLDLVEAQCKQLSKPNMVAQRSNMNQAVRKMLGISLTG